MSITNERLDDLIFRFDAVDNSTAANALRELKALRERYRWIPAGGGVMRQPKNWGTTECIVANSFMQLHRIMVRPRGYCSIHRHQYRSNAFYVERGGPLLIRTYDEAGTVLTEECLYPGDKYTVPPNVLHSFTAVSELVVAFEAYFPEPVQTDDIDRKTIGGIHP